MTEVQEFKKPTGLQIAATLALMALGCFLEAACDWLDALNPPSLTFGAITFDAVGLFFIVLLIGVPIALLVWNKLVAPVFRIPRIHYLQALVLVAVIYWI